MHQTQSQHSHSQRIMTTTGYLELAIGPMFSGKTTWLTNLHKQCTFCNMRVVVVNFAGDTRYAAAEAALLSTHDRTMIPCVMCSSIEELESKHMDDVSAAEVLLINEGQFFGDIMRILRWVDAGKRVYVCGLDGDFEKKRIGAFLDLIPHCDNYLPLCRACYQTETDKKYNKTT